MPSKQTRNPKTYKQNLRFYKLLSFEEKEQFEENIQTIGDSAWKTLEDYLHAYPGADLHEFISGAFLWEKTPQGHHYWEHIAYRDVPADNLSIQIDELTKDQELKNHELRKLEEENQRLKLTVDKLSTVKSSNYQYAFEPCWKEIFWEVQHNNKYTFPVEKLREIFKYLDKYYQAPYPKPITDETYQAT